MPLFQVCKIACDFCPTYADLMLPCYLHDTIPYDYEDLVSRAGFTTAFHPEYNNAERKYACANPECRKKLQEWSEE